MSPRTAIASITPPAASTPDATRTARSTVKRGVVISRSRAGIVLPLSARSALATPTSTGTTAAISTASTFAQDVSRNGYGTLGRNGDSSAGTACTSVTPITTGPSETTGFSRR